MRPSAIVQLLAVSGLAILPATLSAQNPDAAQGETVRIQWQEGARRTTTVGAWVGVQHDSLQVLRDGLTVSVNKGSVLGLDHAIGKRSAAGRGAVIGALAGGLTVGILAAASYQKCQPTGFFSCSFDIGAGGHVLIGFVVGAALGAGIGAIVGGISGRTKWAPINIPSAPPASGPQLVIVRSGAARGVGVRFAF